MHLRVICPECSMEVSLPVGRVVLHANRDLSEGVYAFRCPKDHCGQAVRKPAGAPAIRLMLNGGVNPHLHAPGGPLTLADLTSLLRSLEGTDAALAALVDAVR